MHIYRVSFSFNHSPPHHVYKNRKRSKTRREQFNSIHRFFFPLPLPPRDNKLQKIVTKKKEISTSGIIFHLFTPIYIYTGNSKSSSNILIHFSQSHTIVELFDCNFFYTVFFFSTKLFYHRLTSINKSVNNINNISNFFFFFLWLYVYIHLAHTFLLFFSDTCTKLYIRKKIFNFY